MVCVIVLEERDGGHRPTAGILVDFRIRMPVSQCRVAVGLAEMIEYVWARIAMRRVPPEVDRLVDGIDFHATAVPRLDRLGQKRVAVAHRGRHDAHAVRPDVGGEIAEVQVPVEHRIGVGPDRLHPDAPIVEPVNAADAELAEPFD